VLQGQEAKDNAEAFERYKLQTEEKISEANAIPDDLSIAITNALMGRGPMTDFAKKTLSISLLPVL
jgi:hypothetical protein